MLMELCSGKFLHHSKTGIPKRQEGIWFVLSLPTLTLQITIFKESSQSTVSNQASKYCRILQ